MTKSQIAVFLPIFFSALVICAVVLCTCMYCHRPSFLGLSPPSQTDNPDGSDFTSSSDSTSDLEKGDRQRRIRERVPGYGYGRGTASPDADHIHVVDADDPNPEVEEIDVVEAHPDQDDKGRFLGIF